MKRIIAVFILCICSFAAVYPQIKVDKGIYKAKFSNSLHEPTYVSYILYKGGGGCDRSKFKFINDMPNLKTATDEDYTGKPYEKGHLANAEDFAFDCKKDELTFRYYNCLPQTPNLNRGIWKTVETRARNWSQSESLYIICGGYFGNTKMGNVSVPSYCWKVVQSIKTKKVLFCGWFSNTNNAKLDTLNVSELETKLHSHLTLCK